VFDPASEFIPRYERRRENLEEHVKTKESLLVGP
jgi:hypothetical protein